MTSSAYSFRRRLITVSMCLCVFLAFGATLSADTYQFTPGTGIPVTYLGNSSVGPYGGTLTDLTSNVVGPNSIYFCLTGNTGYKNPEYDNQNLPSLAPTTVSQEEAAFLYSLMLGDEVTTGVTLTVNSSLQVVAHGTPAAISTFDADLGPIQFAMWYVSGTLPTAQAGWGTYDAGVLAGAVDKTKLFSGISDANTRADVLAAYNGYQAFTSTALFKDFVIFTTTNGGQNFIGMVPEPGTMVLFGAGGLLMALGCGRKLLAKRRAR